MLMNNDQSIDNNNNSVKTTAEKIPYKIKYISSKHNPYLILGEDPNYSCNALTNPSNNTSNGWISAPYCIYPQDIIIEFNDKVYVSEMQLISHQYNIAIKIEIYFSEDNDDQSQSPSPSQCQYKKYGYFTLKSNEDTNYQLRELKTITINNRNKIKQIKLSLCDCHINNLNSFCQVGIISLSFFKGYDKPKELAMPPNYNYNYNNELHDYNQLNNLNQFKQDSSSSQRNRSNSNSKRAIDNRDEDDLNNRINELFRAKDKAIEIEDYDEAKRIKSEMDRIKAIANELSRLSNKKNNLIKENDNYSANQIQFEIDKLKQQLNSNYTDRSFAIKQEQIPIQPPDDDNEDLQLKHREERIENPNESNMPLITDKEDKKISIDNDTIHSIELNKVKAKKRDDKAIISHINTYADHNTQPIYHHDLTEDICLIDNEPINPKVNQETKNDNQSTTIQHKNQLPINKTNPYDEIPIKSHNHDFNTLLNEKLNAESGIPNALQINNKQTIDNNVDNDNEEEVNDNEQIPSSVLHQVELLIPILSYPIVNLLLSKKAQNKDKGITQLTTEISNPNSPLMRNQEPQAIFYSSIAACSFGLSTKTIQPLMSSMSLIEFLLKTYPHDIVAIQGFAKTQYDIYSNDCIRLLIDLLAYPNTEVQSKAEYTLLQLSDYPNATIGSKCIYDQLMNNKEIQSSYERSASSRIKMMNTMIGYHKCLPSHIAMNDLMNFAIKGFSSPSKEIRDVTLILIVNIYNYTGDSIRVYFNQLKQKQVNLIEEAILKDQGDNREIRELKRIRCVNERSDYDNDDNNVNEVINSNDDIANSNEVNQEVIDNNIDKDKDNSKVNLIKVTNEIGCKYCSLSDHQTTTTPSKLQYHYEKDCPMLINCTQCNQLIEICGLNFHYTNECINKANFKLCQRCKEAILFSNYSNHISNNKCLPFKQPNLYNRCPLCHKDISPPGKLGWDIHLLSQKCLNNPRTKSKDKGKGNA